MSNAAFGRAIEVRGRSTVGRYRRHEQLPDRDTMRRIFLATGGAVTPNDFFDLPALVASEAAE